MGRQLSVESRLTEPERELDPPHTVVAPAARIDLANQAVPERLCTGTELDALGDADRAVAGDLEDDVEGADLLTSLHPGRAGRREHEAGGEGGDRNAE
jgi:hypothetical protein